METNLLSRVTSLDTRLNTLEDQMKVLEASRSAAQLSLEERLGEFMVEVEQVSHCVPHVSIGISRLKAGIPSIVVQGAARVMVEKVETELKQLDGRLAKQLASWRQETDRNFDTKVDKGELVKLLSRKMDTCESTSGE
jgi:uncharacterized protein Yka (UPF0111/DUF47 family)